VKRRVKSPSIYEKDWNRRFDIGYFTIDEEWEKNRTTISSQT
jgi:hypothetical protein